MESSSEFSEEGSSLDTEEGGSRGVVGEVQERLGRGG
jgi:hypothetical protein